jgi:hypothetical protein
MSNITTLENLGLGDAPAVCSPLDRYWSNNIASEVA